MLCKLPVGSDFIPADFPALSMARSVTLEKSPPLSEPKIPPGEDLGWPSIFLLGAWDRDGDLARPGPVLASLASSGGQPCARACVYWGCCLALAPHAFYRLLVTCRCGNRPWLAPPQAAPGPGDKEANWRERKQGRSRSLECRPQ